jgi:hypothetical protein
MYFKYFWKQVNEKKQRKEEEAYLLARRPSWPGPRRSRCGPWDHDRVGRAQQARGPDVWSSSRSFPFPLWAADRWNLAVSRLQALVTGPESNLHRPNFKRILFPGFGNRFWWFEAINRKRGPSIFRFSPKTWSIPPGIEGLGLSLVEGVGHRGGVLSGGLEVFFVALVSSSSSPLPPHALL